jgi:non-ribosomal peptide synthase protein (TIGR01720 family)
VLKAVKEQLRGIPNQGIGYGVLRYLGDDGKLAKTLGSTQAEVIFNYLGQFDQCFRSRLCLVWLESRAEQPAVRKVAGVIFWRLMLWVSGRGSCDCTGRIARTFIARATVETLAQQFVAVLRSLITHCQSSEAEATPLQTSPWQN